MKKTFAILAVLAMASAPATAAFSGGTFYFKDPNSFSNYWTFNSAGTASLAPFAGWSNGGAFLVSGTVPGTPFTTFCVENGIYFNWNTSYWASVDSMAFQGHSQIPLYGDPISDVTENIYGNWLLQNDLGAQNLGFADLAEMKANQAAISQAIWWAEQEPSGVKNGVATSMLSALGYSAEQLPGGLRAATHVKALNLWNFGLYQTTQLGITGWWATDVQTQLNQDQRLYSCAGSRSGRAWHDRLRPDRLGQASVCVRSFFAIACRH